MISRIARLRRLMMFRKRFSFEHHGLQRIHPHILSRRFKSSIIATENGEPRMVTDEFHARFETLRKTRMPQTRRLEKVIMVLDQMMTKCVKVDERMQMLIAGIVQRGEDPQKRRNISFKLLNHSVFQDVSTFSPSSFEAFVKAFVCINKRDEAVALFERVFPLADQDWKTQFTNAYHHIAEDMLNKMEKNGASAPVWSKQNVSLENIPSTKVVNSILEFESEYSILPSEEQLLRLIDRITQENRRINVEGYNPPMYLKSFHADSIESLMHRMVKHEIRLVPNLVVLDVCCSLISSLLSSVVKRIYIHTHTGISYAHVRESMEQRF